MYSLSTTAHPALGVGRTGAHPGFLRAEAEFTLRKWPAHHRATGALNILATFKNKNIHI